MTTTDKPSIAELQRLSSQPRWDEDDVSDVAAALPVLLEIVAAGLAWKEARDVSIGDAYLRCPAGPSKESRDQLAAAATALLTALGKVQP